MKLENELLQIRWHSSQAKRMYFVLIHCHVYDCVVASLVIVYESERKNHACCTRARAAEKLRISGF